MIDISEEDYAETMYRKQYSPREMDWIDRVIANGTPLPNTGHWISGYKETGALGITYTEKICSNCGWNHSLVIPKNYCPNCGVKMTESEGEK